MILGSLASSLLHPRYSICRFSAPNFQFKQLNPDIPLFSHPRTCFVTFIKINIALTYEL
ncbi:hypothetical protein K443DRAFT_300019 [Laccaria amethystina LaAM-08-1]|uniref:Uncharacterized protein n=1 Tax=Laccaria amethystina LaAM-08-1 TaxID=1095629 RepID=A0A0C9XXN5_9AGAR|nr:hypothetical protein K443DRAFT_300019 [Laccaria amethystina LaAM-08-1]